ncbi:bifunctional adenosylcobinamide kinase/adenosylcobinamide-phosphate guanylyltransferase [uncultured Treponema sp.]|uniref:bifunctional adenosylcobinamide kinase/adenosylcobinamide-phosphate guanylyltransferase n=1 Tax=uncultured Treponema sp. TaxID=162155 RepID=UPI0025FE94E7|nr:bifunctional adenosylcobinamide kinase/adenosylcobinamide-phosphate guanylyltransferase [uncultured Treponema sp.]
MKVLISGGCKNGKSSYAQELAVKEALAANENRPSSLVYFATMIPHDSEDDERIKKHRDDRKNLGFKTIECGKNISEVAKNLELGSVVLFDSLTALVANEMFEKDDACLKSAENPFENLEAEEPEIIQKIQNELEILMNQAASVIFVSDTIFNDGRIYDKTTELYRRILAKTERFVAERCDKLIEMSAKLKIENKKSQAGENKVEKMETEKKLHESDEMAHSLAKLQLVIGGAYQGKASWAKKEFALSDSEISVCNPDFPPDFSKRCISHYENYVAYCLKNNLRPQTHFSDDKIIICDDIFCGVVPIDAFQRKLREETGLSLQKIAENAEVTRIFCGLPQKMSRRG